VRHSFEYSSDLRIPKIQNYLLRLLKEEVLNVEFDIATEYPTIEGYDSNNMNVQVFDVKEHPDVFYDCIDCDYKYDKIVIVEDELSKIGDRSLKFFSGIKNRRPVLDYIHQTSQDNLYDILLIEGDTIEIQPMGVDPDEKEIFKYSYQGWKEDYDEKWDFSEPACSIGGLPDLEYETLRNCIVDVIVPETNMWTNYEPYLSTQKDAEYSVDHLDTGPHLVTVSTMDESGLIDYQELRILVIDAPQIEIGFDSTEHYVLNQDEDAVSIEDKFVITNDGTTLPALLPQPTSGEMIWNVVRINPDGTVQTVIQDSFTFTSQDDVVNSIPIPNDLVEPIDIRTIKSLKISEAGDYRVEIALNLNTGLDGDGSLEFEKVQEFTAYECVPYEGFGGRNIYPYNSGDTLDEAFLGAHSCCEGDITDADADQWKLLDGGTSCYDAYWVGERGKLIEKVESLRKIDELEDYFLSEPTLSNSINRNYASANPENGIYELSLDRSCDNNRGNICAGEVIADISLLESCPKLLISDEPDGQCTGPPEDINQFVATCENYDDGTFESIFKGGSNLCNEEPECSSHLKYNDVGNPNARMQCQATCNGLEGCSQPSKCRCIEGVCNAQCDDSNDFEWENLADGTGICHSNCQEIPICDYQKHPQTKCPSPRPDIKDFSGPADCQDSNPAGITGCYTNVRCTPTGPSTPEFERCQVGEYMDDDGNRMCMFGSAVPLCDASGCNLPKEKENFWCATFGCTCDPINGWV